MPLTYLESKDHRREELSRQQIASLEEKLKEADLQIEKLTEAVTSAQQWQNRSWFTRAFHRWRSPVSIAKLLKAIVAQRALPTEWHFETPTLDLSGWCFNSMGPQIERAQDKPLRLPSEKLVSSEFAAGADFAFSIASLFLRQAGHTPASGPSYGLEILPAKDHFFDCDSARAKVEPIAIHLHAYFVEKLPLIFSYLNRMPFKYDLLISTNSEEKRGPIIECLAESKITAKYTIEVCENRGRDIAPLVVTFGKKLLDYKYALHIHTKKCTGKEDKGRDWLQHCMESLLGSTPYIEALLGVFERDENRGILLPLPYHKIVRAMTWTKNKEIASDFLGLIGVPQEVLDSMPLHFPAGSMFWFRPAALKSLLDSGLSYDHFPAEPIANDGTLAHAIERCILYIAKHHGFSYTSISPHWIL